jgi:hypothetical protein
MAVRLSAPHAGHPLPPKIFLVLISVTGWVDPRVIVRLEGLGQLKNPMTSSGIEPATLSLLITDTKLNSCYTEMKLTWFCEMNPFHFHYPVWLWTQITLTRLHHTFVCLYVWSPIKIFNQLTNYHGIWYQYNATRVQTHLYLFLFLIIINTKI